MDLTELVVDQLDFHCARALRPRLETVRRRVLLAAGAELLQRAPRRRCVNVHTTSKENR